MEKVKPLSFSKKMKEVPFDIDGTKYVLRQATSRSKADWTNNMMDNSKLDGNTGKPVQIKNVGDSEIILLGPNIFEVDPEDGQPYKTPVGAKTIEEWPADVTEALYDKLREISGMEDETEEEKKPENEQ